MKDLWNGRLDSYEEIDLRLWQVIQEITEAQEAGGVCFIGYDTDDGVVRNLGRKGAEGGSNAIRKAIQSFPQLKGLKVYDYRNLEKKNVEEAQKEYSEKIADVLKSGIFPIGLGGGHDIAYGSYLGVRKANPDKKIGIINFDAHLDMRPYDKGRTSGTSFKEIMDNDKDTQYAIVGFQKMGNTERLIKTAESFNVLILEEECSEESTIEALKDFIKKVDIVYVTFCMDVFDASSAPGVSAPVVMGLEPKKGKRLLRFIMETGKVVCVDFAEVNPVYDIDNMTAKLAGCLIYEVMEHIKK